MAVVITVDRQTILEWPQVEALRRAYFTRWETPVQRRGPEAVWYVARVGERVAGCYSVQDAPELGQRWVLDFYRVDGRMGTHAVAAMYRHIYDEAEADGVDVGFTVDPRNEAQLRAVMRYGRASAIGVVFLARTRRVACRQP